MNSGSSSPAEADFSSPKLAVAGASGDEHIRVTLTWQEMYLCCMVANMRMMANLRDRRQPRYGAPPDEGSYEIHLFGCFGEMAVAKHFNLFWAGSIGNFKATDVGGRVQARAGRRSHHSLLLHPDDADHQPFVLALTHDLPSVTLYGWTFGRDGKQPQFWRDPVGDRPAFFVPQSALHPMHELQLLLRECSQ